MVDLGLAQAGIAYMAYNGRLPELGRPLRNITGIAVLNSAVVHLIVGPHARARSIDDLNGLRVATGPIGTGNAATSELLLSDYAAGAIQIVRAGGANRGHVAVGQDRRAVHDFRHPA